MSCLWLRFRADCLVTATVTVNAMHIGETEPKLWRRFDKCYVILQFENSRVHSIVLENIRLFAGSKFYKFGWYPAEPQNIGEGAMHANKMGCTAAAAHEYRLKSVTAIEFS